MDKMLCFIRLTSSETMLIPLFGYQLQSNQERINILPLNLRPVRILFGDDSSKHFEARRCIMAQLPLLHLEAAQEFLNPEQLKSFEKRSFGDLKTADERREQTEYVKKQLRDIEQWDNVKNTLLSMERFKTACRYWANGHAAENPKSCWPPSFLHRQTDDACTTFDGAKAQQMSEETQRNMNDALQSICKLGLGDDAAAIKDPLDSILEMMKVVDDGLNDDEGSLQEQEGSSVSVKQQSAVKLNDNDGEFSAGDSIMEDDGDDDDNDKARGGEDETDEEEL